MSKEEMVRTVFCQAKNGNYIAHQDHVTCEVCAPSAANKATEEGELPALPETEKMFGQGFNSVQMRDYARQAIAADRASRQVANKAEVVPVAIWNPSFEDWLDVHVGSCNSGILLRHAGTGDEYDSHLTELREKYRDRFATPPATTGASTVLTDERMRSLYEAWELAEAERRKGEPLDEGERTYVVKRCPGASDTYNIAPAAWPAFKAGCEVAAQAGQVAVPGWQFVPTEPTHEMINAAEAISNDWPRCTWIEAYKAMLAASPSPAKESK